MRPSGHGTNGADRVRSARSCPLGGSHPVAGVGRAVVRGAREVPGARRGGIWAGVRRIADRGSRHPNGHRAPEWTRDERCGPCPFGAFVSARRFAPVAGVGRAVVRAAPRGPRGPGRETQRSRGRGEADRGSRHPNGHRVSEQTPCVRADTGRTVRTVSVRTVRVRSAFRTRSPVRASGPGSFRPRSPGWASGPGSVRPRTPARGIGRRSSAFRWVTRAASGRGAGRVPRRPRARTGRRVGRCGRRARPRWRRPRPGRTLARGDRRRAGG